MILDKYSNKAKISELKVDLYDNINTEEIITVEVHGNQILWEPLHISLALSIRDIVRQLILEYI